MTSSSNIIGERHNGARQRAFQGQLNRQHCAGLPAPRRRTVRSRLARAGQIGVAEVVGMADSLGEPTRHRTCFRSL